MSRNKKNKKKQSKGHQQKLRRRKLAARRTGAPRALDVCQQATELFERRLFHEAREMLEQYEATNPGHPDVLRLLLDVYHEQCDYGPYCVACRHLVKMEPENPVLRLMLAAGFMGDARIASALTAFRQFVELWPTDPLADGARESISRLEPAVDGLLQEFSLTGDGSLESLVMHEEILACLARGDYRRTIQIGEQMLTRNPNFIPAINNLSEAYYRTGQLANAIAMSRRVLGEEPENIHALANLTRYLYLTGQQDEARALRKQLQAVPSVRADTYCKKCEVLGYFGDDEGILAVFEDARRSGATRYHGPEVALLYHLAATATARQGHHRRAVSYWRKALEIQPDLDLASANLEDAARPVSERHGPWYFSLPYWGFGDSLDKLLAMLGRPEDRSDDQAVIRVFQRFTDAHPEVVRLVPALLDHGDESAREFAWRLATVLGTPDMRDALREFSLSQRGPDAMRMETASRLVREGTLPSGCVRMWLDGRWRDLELAAFEIRAETDDGRHCPQVDDWLFDGIEALRAGKGQEAEKFFQMCLDLEGEMPDLLNNLAASYQQQGRIKEAHSLARQIHERWPNYFFGRVAMAHLAIGDKDWDLAESYLTPLRQRQRLHTTEFTAFASANIRLLLARGNVNEARRWVETWRQVDPEHPDFARVESKCSAASVLGVFQRLFREGE